MNTTRSGIHEVKFGWSNCDHAAAINPWKAVTCDPSNSTSRYQITSPPKVSKLAIATPHICHRGRNAARHNARVINQTDTKALAIAIRDNGVDAITPANCRNGKQLNTTAIAARPSRIKNGNNSAALAICAKIISFSAAACGG